jgi:hypothetical protein
VQHEFERKFKILISLKIIFLPKDLTGRLDDQNNEVPPDGGRPEACSSFSVLANQSKPSYRPSPLRAQEP